MICIIPDDAPVRTGYILDNIEVPRCLILQGKCRGNAPRGLLHASSSEASRGPPSWCRCQWPGRRGLQLWKPICPLSLPLP